jgi:hypothetical protein
MINYDLPWNPNAWSSVSDASPYWLDRGVPLWNLVAAETREGEVYDAFSVITSRSVWRRAGLRPSGRDDGQAGKRTL